MLQHTNVYNYFIFCVVFPEPTRRAEAPPTLPPREADDLIYNKEQAWEYYQKFIKVSQSNSICDNWELPSILSLQAEKKLRQRRHRNDAIEFFGSAGETLY